MKVVLQRVQHAAVQVEQEQIANIDRGILLLLGVTHEDTNEDILWLSNKIANLRIFDDPEGTPNLSVKDINGELLVISQFTLFARTRKGNRPSFIDAAPPEEANELYLQFVKQLKLDTGLPIATGKFGAEMAVELINDGPFTIIIDSKDRGKK